MSRAGLLLGLALVVTSARADQAVFALVVGNNAPPRGEAFADLPRLRYADDDAVRWAGFLDGLADRIELLTVPDEETQRRFSGAAGRARPPTEENLRRAMAGLAAGIEAARASGRETVLYVAWSGHGAIGPDGRAVLALLDGGLDRDRLRALVLEPAGADFIHLVVDACHAEAVVGARGMFDMQADSLPALVAPAEALALVQATEADHLPGLGVLIATSVDQEAHEWSRIQAGVFTHVVLSGLSGAADVNGDSRIEYSEIHAFVAAANRDIPDPRAVPRVISRAPRRDLSAPLVDLARLRGVAWLRGDPSRLGHFHIELAGGQRYLDAHLALDRVAIAVPAGVRAYLRTRTAEAELGPDGGSLDELRFGERRLEKRGSLDAALRQALFASPYDRTYYNGFVDSRGLVGVRFDRAAVEVAASAPEAGPRKPLAIACWAAAGAALTVAAVTAGLSLDARNDFMSTDLQRPAREANQRYQAYGTAAVVTGAGAAVLALVGWWLWPGQPGEPALTAGAGPTGFAVTGRW